MIKFLKSLFARPDTVAIFYSGKNTSSFNAGYIAALDVTVAALSHNPKCMTATDLVKEIRTRAVLKLEVKKPKRRKS